MNGKLSAFITLKRSRTKSRRDHAIGGVRPISLQTSTSEPRDTAGSAWIVVAFNVDFKWTLSDFEICLATLERTVR